MKSILLFAFILTGNLLFSQEICNNGIDDDADGLVDLNDSECTCTSSGGGTPSSLIPNPSFEVQACCPTFYSELNCAQGWIQASDATSDYMNTCDFVMGGAIDAGLTPFPDGDGAVGAVACQDYKEYIGACLTTPLVAGTPYTIQMSAAMFGIDPSGTTACDISSLTPLQWTIFGSTSCSDIPFFGMDCPGTPFVALGSASLAADAQYHLLTITFTPTANYTTLVIGPPCQLAAGYPSTFDACFPYVIADNLIVNTSSSFGSVSVASSGSLCANSLVITATVSSTGGTYQWYQDGVAIVGQTNATLNVSALSLGGGDFQVVYIEGTDCATDEINIPDATVPTVDVNDASMCPGETAVLTATGTGPFTWSPSTGLSATTGATVQATPGATTVYTVSVTSGGCTASATSTVTVTDNIDFTASITPNPMDISNPVGQCVVSPPIYDYTWVFPDQSQSNATSLSHTFEAVDGNQEVWVIAESAGGCIDSVRLIVVVESPSIYYVPNTFTPDGDENNNIFTPVFTTGFDEYSFHMTIYNRWGETVFETKDATKGWDGTYHGKLVPKGSYSWTISFKSDKSDEKIEENGHVNVMY